MRLIGDLETNGLLNTVSTIHCLVLKNPDTGECGSFADHPGYRPIDEGLAWLAEADESIWHNGVGYDIPVLRKLKPAFKLRDESITDTLIYSKLLWPKDVLKGIDSAKRKRDPNSFPGKLLGSHKLEAFGYRIGLQKGDYAEEMKSKGLDPWAQWSKSMQDYCELDVDVTEALWRRCIAKGYAEQALRLEHDAKFIIAEMERTGFPFREKEATELYAKVAGERAKLEQELNGTFAPWYVSAGVVTPRRSVRYKDKLKGNVVEGAPYTKIKHREFNPNSREQIADRLIKLRGWKPEEFTDGGSPKVDETVLAGLPYPEAKPLARYFLLQKRAAQISEGDEGWMKVSREGVIYGAVDTLGAVTRRGSHFSPNIAQVPKVGSYFGEECRALFWCGEGLALVGADLAGIELRMLAHYMAKYDGGAYGNAVVNGKSSDGTDVHSLNCKALGMEPRGLYVVAGKQVTGRDCAKTFIYAFLYGAGAAKLAKILGRPESVGAKLKAKFLDGLPALKALIDDVQAAAQRGYLRGLDGGAIPVRSQHAAPNTLLQGAGAIVAKQWLVESRRRYQAAGWRSGADYWLRAWVHDETQTATRPEIADAFGKETVAAIEDTGRILKLRVPITGEYKIGRTWADTH